MGFGFLVCLVLKVLIFCCFLWVDVNLVVVVSCFYLFGVLVGGSIVHPVRTIPISGRPIPALLCTTTTRP